MKTALLCLAFASAIFALLLWLTARKSGPEHVISVLAWAKLVQGTAFLLLFGRDVIPDVLSKYLGNSLLFSGCALECIAAWIFAGKTRWKEVVLPFLVLSIWAMNAGIMAKVSGGILGALASFTVAFFMIMCSVAFLRGKKAKSRLSWTIGVTDSVVGLANIVRGTVVLSVPDFTVLSPYPAQYWAIGSFFLFIFTNGFGFLLLIKEEDDQRLKKSEARLRQIIDLVPHMLFVKDRDGKHLLANQAIAEVYNTTVAAITGTRHTDLHSDKDEIERMMQDDREVIEKKETKFIPFEPFTDAHGNLRYLQTTKVPFHVAGEETTAVLGIAIDITSAKRAEEERKNLQERLHRAEKMEALGTLAGGVAHDLNNVLGIVVGYAEMLLYDLEESNPARPRAMQILKGGQRAAAIVQDLLTLARRGVSSRKVLNLNNIIVECRNSPEFAKVLSDHPGVEIRTDLEADLLNIAGSSVHLEKSLINLVSNAAEAMPAGGRLSVTTANCYLDRQISGYDEVREGDYVVLSVSDTGEGIAAPDLKRIFEPFYTKKVMGRSGTGLGLAVVWGTVKDHLGYINVKSEEGMGTTFTLYFPVTREGLSRGAAPLSIDIYMGNGESVLVVDDVKEQRELAGAMLAKLNYRVASVSSGEEAVESLKHDPVDLVILDMIMDPGMDGLDTYSKILEIRPRQKAIVVSGFSETERVNKTRALGAGAYVKKPYVLEHLGLAVRKELDRSA